jgi:hypothetical protein
MDDTAQLPGPLCPQCQQPLLGTHLAVCPVPAATPAEQQAAHDLGQAI